MKVKIQRVPSSDRKDFKLEFSGEILGSDIARLKTAADEEMASTISDPAQRPPPSFIIMAIAVMFLRSEEKKAAAAANDVVHAAREKRP